LSNARAQPPKVNNRLLCPRNFERGEEGVEELGAELFFLVVAVAVAAAAAEARAV
jgi:hypothetical protein